MPSAGTQRLLLTGGDSAKPAKAAAAAKEAGEAAVPVTANSANADELANGGTGAAEDPGAQEVEETPGQLVELKFRAPRAGKYDLSLYCVSGKHPPQILLVRSGIWSSTHFQQHRPVAPYHFVFPEGTCKCIKVSEGRQQEECSLHGTSPPDGVWVKVCLMLSIVLDVPGQQGAPSDWRH